MPRQKALLAVCFCAGVLGGLGSSLLAWMLGQWGLTALVGISFAPEWTTAWLYPRLIWGGLWGLLFFLLIGHPRSRQGWIRKGLWLSLLPSAVQLLLIFPGKPEAGYLGLGLGNLMPLLVLLLNACWGIGLGFFTRLLWGRG